MSSFRHSFALVISIDSYSNGIPHLKTAVNDAIEIAKVLEVEHGYTVIQLFNEEATREQIQHVLEVDLLTQIQPSDRLLFYFAGHGIALNGEDGPEGYLVPQDARLGDVGTYLPMSQVHNALLQLPCRHFLGILDCCFAGAFRWSGTRKLSLVESEILHKERFDRFIQDSAWQVITSAAYDQTALDAFDLKQERGQVGKHSPFAAALIEALEGLADNHPPAAPGRPAGDGVITATELYLYLRDRVEPATEARAVRQTPGIHPLKKHDKGEYIFLVPGHPLNLPPAPPLDASKNPYRGLQSFEEEHKNLFFGRKALTQTLYEFFSQQGLTVVLGASGSGKSSLVKAGLIPKLRQHPNTKSWLILPPFRPGESPFKALSNVLTTANLPSNTQLGEAFDHLSTATDGLTTWFNNHSEANVVLITDQLEELITLCQDQQERQQFLETLAYAISTYPKQFHLVVTLRSDFEPQFRNTPLERYWSGRRFVVPAMSREELREAIEEPASARVIFFDPHNLVDQLIDEVANMPGALPLLSFALSELYLKYLHRQEKAKLEGETIERSITQADYNELGGVTRSLTQRADQEYEELVQKDPAYAQSVQRVMLRMVSLGTDFARRRVMLSELEYSKPEDTRVKAVILNFEKARLLTCGVDGEGQPYVEPAHDVLIRGWQKLLEWKQQELAGILLQREVTPIAGQWANSNKRGGDYGLLWADDPRLPQAMQLLCGSTYKDTWFNFLKWLSGKYWASQKYDFWFNSQEEVFIKTSFNEKYKRLRNIVGITASVITLLTGLTLWARYQQNVAQINENIARTNENIAQTNERSAYARQLALEAELVQNGPPHLMATAILLAVSAYQESPQTVEADVSRILSQGISLQGKPINSYSPGEALEFQQLFPANAVDDLNLKKHSNSETIGSLIKKLDERALNAFNYPISLFGIDKDGSLLGIYSTGSGASFTQGIEDDVLSIWDISTSQEIARILYNIYDPVVAIAFDPGKKYLTVKSSEKVQTYELNHFVIRSSINDMPIAYAIRGKTLLGLFNDISKNWLRIYDLYTGEMTFEIGKISEQDEIAISPNGEYLAHYKYGTSSVDIIPLSNAAETINLSTPDLETSNDEKRLTLNFSSDGHYLILIISKNQGAGTVETSTKIWNILTKQEVSQIPWTRTVPSNLKAITSDGKLLATVYNAVGYSRATVEVIDLTSMELLSNLSDKIQHDASITDVIFSSDNRYIATASNDRSVKIWEVSTGKQIAQINSESKVKNIYFSSDDKDIVIITESGGIKVQPWQASDLVEQACNNLSRNFTWQEWRQYFGEKNYEKTCKNLPVHRSVLEAAMRRAMDKDIDGAVTIFRRVLEIDPEADLNPATKELDQDPKSLADQIAKQGTYHEW